MALNFEPVPGEDGVSDPLRSALRQAADQFRFYEREHVAKGAMEKAATNGRFANLCETALSVGQIPPADCPF